MAKQVIDTTTLQPNGKQGEPVRTAFNKSKSNFDELYARTGGTADLPAGAIALLNSKNLSDVESAATARGNLGVGVFGPAAPAATFPFMDWIDTSNAARPILKRRNAANTAWAGLGPVFMEQTTRQASYTSNGSFTVPQDVYSIFVSGVAGGGGGGGSAGSVTGAVLQGAGGGAGQSIVKRQFSVTPGATISIAIGAAGIGGAGGGVSGAGTRGTSGGSTVIGALITLSAGQGGYGGASAGPSQPGSGYPNGSMGPTVLIAGAEWPLAGAGASSPFGGGGSSVTSLAGSVPGASAGGYGAGGAGGAGPTAASQSGGKGGDGTAGIVLIEW